MWRLTSSEVDHIRDKHALRLVLLHAPYNHFDDREVGDLFLKVLSLKMNGYRGKHTSRVLPIDSCDFFGTHIVICSEDDQGALHPINAYKSVAAAALRHHSIEFPAISLARSCSPQEESNKAIESIASHLRDAALTAYNCSWTMDPRIESGSSLRHFLYEATLATLIQFYSYSRSYPVISAGVVRFGVDAWKQSVGFENLSFKGEPVGLLRTPIFSNSDLRFMILENPSELGIEKAALFEKLWTDRIELGAPPLFQTLDQVAA